MTSTNLPDEREYRRECEKVAEAYEKLSPVKRKIFENYLNSVISMLNVILELNKEKT